MLGENCWLLRVLVLLRVPVGCYCEYHYFIFGVYYYLYACVVQTVVQALNIRPPP